ncbi:MAG: type II secretion system protein [Candidatus Omnitrophica bacterium]|nr:type II secretion system protein [Candidatus Omnitrophota bacterium]
MTLLEILLAMVILGLVASGIFSVFVFGRRVSFRSESELVGINWLQAVADQLRLSVGGTGPAGLPKLAPGVYVDQKLGNSGPFASQRPPFKPPTATATARVELDLPAEFQARYQTAPGTANDFSNHGDGVVMVVEDHVTDLDGDGKKGLDFNGDGQTDLYRVRLYIKKTTPAAH